MGEIAKEASRNPFAAAVILLTIGGYAYTDLKSQLESLNATYSAISINATEIVVKQLEIRRTLDMLEKRVDWVYKNDLLIGAKNSDPWPAKQ